MKKTTAPKPRFEYQPGWERRVPAELRTLDHWIVWRYVLDSKHGRWLKVPFTPEIGFAHPETASATDPKTWRGFDQASLAYRESRKPMFRFAAFSGLGFCFHASDPYCGIDLDHCLRTDGALEDWARPIYEELKGGYCEVSPSGEGLKFFARGGLVGAGMRTTGLGGDDTGSIEIYDKGRYFTCTGNVFGGAPSRCVDRGEAVIRLVATYRPAAPPVATVADAPAVPVAAAEDDERIERARHAANGMGAAFRRLFDLGEFAGCSHSEADFRLARLLGFWFGRDPIAIDRAFRRSKLMRPKWDERRGGGTYGGRTIANALGRNTTQCATTRE